MAYTVSTLLLGNLHDVFGEIDPVRRRAAIDEIFHEDAVFHEPNGIYRGRDEIDRIAGASRLLIPTFNTSRSPRPRSWAMGGGSVGCRAALVSRRITPEPISSSPGAARSPPSISSLTCCRDLDAAAATSIAPPQSGAAARKCSKRGAGKGAQRRARSPRRRAAQDAVLHPEFAHARLS